MLLLGITMFGEPFTRVQAVTFGLIWTALAIYSWDTVRVHRQRAGTDKNTSIDAPVRLK